MSFFVDLWNLIDVDIEFRCKIFLFAVRTVFLVPSKTIFDFPLYFPSNDVSDFFSENG